MPEPASAELARFEREAFYDRRMMAPKVRPGSTTEQDALDRIDELRDEEFGRRDDTFEARRKRLRTYWGKRR